VTVYPPPSKSPNNTDLLIWCLYLLGGSDKFIDIEDLFLKIFELAPARLSWRTRPEFPDYKKCSSALQSVENFKRSDYTTFLVKNGLYLRKLSTTGSAWCEKHKPHLEIMYSSGTVPSTNIQDDGKLIRSIESSDLYISYLKNSSIELSVYLIAELFRCMPDANAAIWAARLDLAESAAKRNNKETIQSFINACRQKVSRGTN
jgi:hypothetical protein